MPIVFIPVTDYSTNANEAETFSSADIGFVHAGGYASLSFRLGNTSQVVQNVSLGADNLAVSLPEGEISLAPGGCSNTLSLRVNAPIDCLTGGEIALVTAGDAELLVSWQTVGANVDRLPQTPDRTGDFSDNITDVIGQVGEPLRLYRFDPVAYDPDDIRIFVAPGGRFRSQGDVCCRLDPTDDRWGYTRSDETIVGSFQAEDWTQTDTFTRDSTEVTRNGSAVLYLPADYELTREWALFNPAVGPDRAQFKRTVYLTQRQGQVWCLWSIVPVYRSGSELGYFYCNLLPLSEPTMGAPSYFNPFAFTYEYESNRPYAHYPCHSSLSFTEIEVSGSGMS